MNLFNDLRILMIDRSAGYAMTALAAFLTVVPRLSQAANTATPPESATRTGDEIIVCGERFHTGAPVVLWTDKGGYDFHYSRAPGSPDERKPRHVRISPLTDALAAQVRSAGWTPELLRDSVDQFVIHYSVDGTSRLTFEKLVSRHLSVQLMLDLDGTIYQAMDLQEEAPHATKANGRSVGIEIANLGAYSGNIAPLNEWYKKDASGKIAISIPGQFGDGGIRTKDFVGRPARPESIKGVVQGKLYEQYDLTPQQYNSLIHLTAALCSVFPKITCDYPRQKLAFGPSTGELVKDGPASHPNALAGLNELGVLIRHALSGEQYEVYQGLLGHYHVQTDKQDPGSGVSVGLGNHGCAKTNDAGGAGCQCCRARQTSSFYTQYPGSENRQMTATEACGFTSVGQRAATLARGTCWLAATVAFWMFNPAQRWATMARS